VGEGRLLHVGGGQHRRPGVRVGGVLRGSSDVSKWAKLDMFERRERTASVGVTPLIAPLVATPMRFLPRVKRGGFVLQRATKLAKD